MSPSDRPTLSVAETAALLGISRWLVQQAVRDGSLPSLRLGRRILIPRARLLGWLEGEAQPTAPAGTVGGEHADPTVRAV
jgi:excisionase family DNA binding protein